MHGLRREFLEQQIKALGIPFSTLELPEQPSMEEYESLMSDAVKRLQQYNFECAGFGDIFLEDLKAYREHQLARFNLEAVFPIWKKDTHNLLNEIISLGFKAITVCVDAKLLDVPFAGRLVDEKFYADLPENVDPCGENGEFHTFCFDGPIFKSAIPFIVGEKIYREYDAPGNKASFTTPRQKMGFWFCDLLPL